MKTNLESNNTINEILYLPSYDELLSAFCHILDGVKNHDIQSMTGLPDKDVEDIISIRNAVMPLWKPNAPIKNS